MRILVTGASGFIGRWAVKSLIAQGAEVHTVSRDGSSAPAGATGHAADLLDPGAARPLVAAINPSHILHLAWIATPGIYWTSAQNLDWVAASLALYRAFAEQGGRRFIVAGTCAEYDWSHAVLHETECPRAPWTLYGVAKDSLHRMLAQAAPADGVALGWGRVHFLYGPGEAPGRLVSEVAKAVLSGEPVETTEGTQKRDFMHVADCGGAFASFAASDVVGPVNIATGIARPVRDLVTSLADAAGSPDLPQFGVRPLQPGEPPLLDVPVQRLTQEVGFTPVFDLETGLRDTLNWWRDHGS